MRQYMYDHNISYCFLGNEGIEGQAPHRIRHGLPITTKTLGKLCRILKCRPADLIEYIAGKEAED